MFKKLIVLALVLSFASAASAVYYVWDDDSGDHTWETATNWNPDITGGTPSAVMTTADTPRFYTGVGAPDSTSNCYGTYSLSRIQSRYPNSNVTLTFKTGSDVTCQGSIQVENNLGGMTTTWVIENGATVRAGDKQDPAAVYGNIFLGRASRAGDAHLYVDGTLTNLSNNSYPNVMQVGTWSAGNYAGSDAHLYIGATGVVSVDAFEINIDGLDIDALIDITTGGKLVAAGDVTSLFKDYRALGLILGDSTVGNVKATFDGTDTTIEVPEPMTIALLGLGGLLLRKRR